MKKYLKLFMFSFSASLLCLITIYAISAFGISTGNEQKAYQQLTEIMERGTLTEEQFIKLQEKFDSARMKNADAINTPKALSQRAREYSRFANWVPWFVLSIVLIRYSPFEVSLLMTIPILLFVGSIFTYFDIIIFALALIIGRKLRQFVDSKGFSHKLSGQ